MDIKKLYRGCRSYRRFAQEPVSSDDLMQIMENARIASCSRNSQTVRYVVVTSSDIVDRMQPLVHWAASLPQELGTPKKGEQPTAFITVSCQGKPSAMNYIDMGIAVNTIATSAWARGIGSCIMGAIDTAAIRDLLQIPDDQELKLVIALGKPSHRSTIVEIPEDGSKTYYLDEERNYYVPKLSMEEIARFI
ncbi:MAG: nitroreductase family protein [Anaerovoracaceae bacterium]